MNRFLLFIPLLFIGLIASAQNFEDISIDLGIDFTHDDNELNMGGGVAFFDYDNDGDEDLYLTGGAQYDRLYRNEGDGTFTDISFIAGTFVSNLGHTIGVTTGDIDNDGFQDILVTNFQEDLNLGDTIIGFRNFLLKNNQDGTFTDIGIQAGMVEEGTSFSAAMGDVNLDGYLDIYIGNYVTKLGFADGPGGGFTHKCGANHLYINNQDGTFTEMSEEYGVANAGCTLGTLFTDFDYDGDLDLIVSNDFGQYVIPSAAYRNNYPDPTFTDIMPDGLSAIYGMGTSVGDFDEDGDFDYYETNIGRNILHKNEDGNAFTDWGTEAVCTNEWVPGTDQRATGWNSALQDFNNDTYLDLWVVNGRISATSDTLVIPVQGYENPNAFFMGDGDGTFTDVSSAVGMDDPMVSRGGAFADFDNDGDLDVCISTLDVIFGATPDWEPHILLYENTATDLGNYLQVRLTSTDSAPNGIGSKVEIYVDGRKLIREIGGGSGHASRNSLRAHFGLGEYAAIDSMRVLWTSGHIDVLYQIDANQIYDLTEGTGFGVSNNNIEINGLQIFPTLLEKSDELQVRWQDETALSYSIMDAAGKEISKGILSRPGSISLQELGLQSGIYFIQLNGKGIHTEKIIVQ